MLQVDRDARRRFNLMLGAISFLLFSLVLSGLWQRLGEGNSVIDDRVNELTIAKARETSARIREARKALEELGKEGKWDEAVALAAERVKSLDAPALRYLYAEALYRAGSYDKAVNEFEPILSATDPVAVADKLAIRRDYGGYRRHCENLLKQVTSEIDPLTANNLAWACVTAKEGLSDYTKPVELARLAVAGAERHGERWTYLNTLGVTLYRAGQDKEAIARLMEAEKLNSDTFNWPFLALAHHRLGNSKEANKWYDRLRTKMDTTYATLNLSQSRHELLMFLREIEEAFAP
jgi:tetratricopeptide (TPR) repeat protein